MKILKIYEDTNYLFDSCEIMHKYIKQRDELHNFKYEILKKVEEFISLNEEYFLDEYKLKNNFLILNDFEFVQEGDTTVFRITDVFGKNYHFLKKDFKNLAEYLENPELYKTTKKYNL